MDFILTTAGLATLISTHKIQRSRDITHEFYFNYRRISNAYIHPQNQAEQKNITSEFELKIFF
jgi:hypothetical protein